MSLWSKYFSYTLIISLLSCTGSFDKEIGEVENLIAIVDNMEKSLLSVDTSKVYKVKRQMELDINDINTYRDTLTKEEAFLMDDLFSGKKSIFRLTKNYSRFVNLLNFSKNQLNNLKQDMENGFISREDFEKHIAKEQSYVMDLNKKINKSVDGLDQVLLDYENERDRIKGIINSKEE